MSEFRVEHALGAQGFLRAQVNRTFRFPHKESFDCYGSNGSYYKASLAGQFRQTRDNRFLHSSSAFVGPTHPYPVRPERLATMATNSVGLMGFGTCIWKPD